MKMMKKRMNRHRSGFTLLEVLLVVVILGMLAALVVPGLMGTRDKANMDITKSLVSKGGTLATQIDLFRLHMNRYPTSLEELTKLPDDAEERAKYGTEPYISEATSLKDAWQQELQYKQPGDINTASYDLYSFGPDMKEGGGDDIGNWSTDKK